MLMISIKLFMDLVSTSQWNRISDIKPRKPLFLEVGKPIFAGTMLIYVVSVGLLMRRPIKHVLNDSQLGKAGNAQYTITLVKGVVNADPYGAAQSEVNAGSAIVTHIELECEAWVDNQTVASANIWEDLHYYIWFNVAGAQTKPVAYSVGTSDLKNQVFHQGMRKLSASTVVVTNSLSSSEQIRRWSISLNIPKWAQKINKDDQIQLVMDFTNNAAANHNFQIQAIFKEIEQT